MDTQRKMQFEENCRGVLVLRDRETLKIAARLYTSSSLIKKYINVSLSREIQEAYFVCYVQKIIAWMANGRIYNCCTLGQGLE